MARPETQRAKGSDLRVLRRVWPFIAPYWIYVVLAGIGLVIAAGTLLAFGAGLGWLIDEGLARGHADNLDLAFVALVGVILLLAAATFLRAYFVNWIGERLAADLRRAAFDKLIHLSPAYFELTRVGEIVSRLTTDATLLQSVLGGGASMALRNLLVVFGGTAMLFVTAPRLALYALLGVPAVVAPLVIFGRRVRALSRAAQDRLGDVGADLNESLGAIRAVQAFNQEAATQARFAARIGAAFEAARRLAGARAGLAALIMMLVFGAVGVVLWIGGRATIAGTITPGQLSAFIFYAVTVASALGALSEFYADLQRAAGATERLFEIIEATSAVADPAAPLPMPEPPLGTIAFENVTFAYPTRPADPALRGLSFAIKGGESVALVGPSGAGKTTVFQLLLRFYDPQSGVVRVDGVDVRAAALSDLRARIGLVPQDPVIFNASVADNIRFGRPTADDAAIARAAEAAQAAEFIARLPQGMNTLLGERGVLLSGGQRQRIAIARAILKDPPVLLLDEATSALDAESERAVQAAIERLARDRTVLVIAHRLATVQRADRILVLDHGRLAAEGSHGALIAQDGLYARLARLQFTTD